MNQGIINNTTTIVLLLVIIACILSGLYLKFKKKIILLIIQILFAISFIMLVVMTFYFVSNFIYVLLRIFMLPFYGSDVSSYISLTVTLIIISFLPNWIIFLAYQILEFFDWFSNKISNKLFKTNDKKEPSNLSVLLNLSIKNSLQIKSVVYLLALLITVFNSLNILYGSNNYYFQILQNTYVKESVFTFLIFDNLITAFNEDKIKLLTFFKSIKDR